MEDKYDMQLGFGNIYVNSISGSSGIFIGENWQSFGSTSTKSNIGLCRITGNNNYIIDNTGVVFDDDMVDMYNGS